MSENPLVELLLDRIKEKDAELTRLRDQYDEVAQGYKDLETANARLRDRCDVTQAALDNQHAYTNRAEAENARLREALLQIASMLAPAALAVDGYRELQSIARNALRETT